MCGHVSLGNIPLEGMHGVLLPLQMLYGALLGVFYGGGKK